MYPYRRYAAFLAVFTAVLFAALIVAAFGYISLLTETDVIGPGVGVAVGPLAAGASVVVLFVMLLLNGVNTPAEQQRLSPLRALGVAALAYGAFLLVGGMLAGLGEAVTIAVFIGSMVGSPAAIAIAVIAFVLTLIYQWMLVIRMNERGRPRWPWERDEDE